jgi:hypothetical protein
MTNVSIIGNFDPDVCPSDIIAKIVAGSARLHPVTVSAMKYIQALLETVIHHS